MSETSASLLERLRSQPDGDSWQRLLDLYTPLLHSWLHRHGLQPSDIDDLVQEVLAVVVRELPHFQHNQRPGAFRSWLRTILVHRLRDFWRKRQTRPLASGDSDLQRVLEELENPDSGLSRLWDEEHEYPHALDLKKAAKGITMSMGKRWVLLSHLDELLRPHGIVGEEEYIPSEHEIIREEEPDDPT